MDDAATRAVLVSKLGELSGARRIGAESEVYYDLGLSGDDFHELIDWIGETFQTDFSSMNTHDFSPDEGEDLVPRFVDRWLGPRPYKSLTVGHLLAAVESRRWSYAE